ncbi:energy-coupled thiamine transporter ThiT [Vaginisenegalia massiliensis]|uniref:energy-coupled thiamine transporter ThiT n=1 Tax=Vaginisenegalia massiliensis TaxID=2058294 RepID=UPI0013DDA5CC|nr:energy-coupled thiamine transporter ThiT [Vaginisenegalia massiliensis]
MNARSKRLMIDIVISLFCVVILSYVTQLADKHVSNYLGLISILPVIWVALRHGWATGVFLGGLSGLVVGLFQGQATHWQIWVISTILPLMLAGVAGLFAKYTQKTLNNRRYSSTFLNIGTGSFLASLLAGVVKGPISRLSLAQTEAFNWSDPNLWIQMGLSFVIGTLILCMMAKAKASLLIPKRSKYLSRRETSSLLND